jgi:hypothetical protein
MLCVFVLLVDRYHVKVITKDQSHLSIHQMTEIRLQIGLDIYILRIIQAGTVLYCVRGWTDTRESIGIEQAVCY